MSTPRVPRDCYLYLWYLCARYVSFAPISCMMRDIRVVLMRGKAGHVAVVIEYNNKLLLDQKPCIEDLFTRCPERRLGHNMVKGLPSNLAFPGCLPSGLFAQTKWGGAPLRFPKRTRG